VFGDGAGEINAQNNPIAAETPGVQQEDPSLNYFDAVGLMPVLRWNDQEDVQENV